MIWNTPIIVDFLHNAGEFLFWCWLSMAAISKDNYNKIQIGMTKGQVESLIGPPRWDVKPKNPRWIDPESIGHLQWMPTEWWGKEGVVQIWYSRGRVSEKKFTKHRCEVVPLTILEKLPINKPSP